MLVWYACALGTYDNKIIYRKVISGVGYIDV